MTNKQKFEMDTKKEYTIPLWKLCEDSGIDFKEVIELHCPQKRSFSSNWKDRTYIRIRTDE